MLTSIRGLSAASLSAGLLFAAAPAFASEGSTETSAEEAVVLDTSALRATQPVDETRSSKGAGESGLEISGNVALVSDYRFRGVSFSDGDMALQGGIDVAHESGIYVGTWGSSITGSDDFGELELDIYAGWSGDLSDAVSVDVGLLYYIYPTGNTTPGADTDYFEPYASISTSLGGASATFGVAYAWDQASLGDDDNLYLYTDLEYGIPDTPITVSAHLGYTDGVFATDVDTVTLEQSASFDWGLGASWAVTDSLSLGVNYVDTEGPSVEDFTDAGIFFTLGYSM